MYNNVKEKFYIDGYDKNNNIAYEVDEQHHKYQKEYDMMREEKIKNILGCKFIRINDTEFLQNKQQTKVGDFNGTF